MRAFSLVPSSYPESLVKITLLHVRAIQLYIVNMHEQEQQKSIWDRVAENLKHAVAPVEQARALTPEEQAAMRQDLNKTFELRK